MPDIRYQFIASGQESVRGAIRGISDEQRSADKIADEIYRRGRTRERETARSQTTARDHTKKLAEQVAKDQEKAARHVAGIKERHFREEARKEEQAQRKQERETVRAEAQKQRALAAGIVARRTEVAKEIATRRAHENKLEQIGQTAASRRAEAEKKHQKTLGEIRASSERRLAQITSRAKDATSSRDAARAFDQNLQNQRRAYELEKKRQELRDRSRDELRSEIGGTLRGAVLGGAVAAGALGIGVAGAAARDAIRLQELSNRISISARGAGEEAVDPAALRREFQQTAISTPGIRSVDVAAAVAQFVGKTGNLDVARRSQGVFATVASATGSQVQDVAAAAADLFQKFNINTVEGMADAMAALAFQGKAGAFELKDAASQFAKLSAAASRFGLDKGAGGVRVLGGLTQIARSATGSPEQAATAVEAMFRQFTSREATKQLRAIGVNPFKDKKGTQTKDVRELIVETISKSGGNLTKLQGIFGDEGIRAISPIISAFNEAEKRQKGTGAATARAFVDDAINAPGDFNELKKDAAQAQQDASAKLAATWEKLSAEVGDRLVPVITEFVEAIAGSPASIEAFVGVIEILTGSMMGWIRLFEDVAETLGLITKKKKTPEQIRDEERKKAETLQGQLERFDKKRGGSWDQEARLRASGKIVEADAMAKRLRETAFMDEERQTLAGKFEAQRARVGEAQGALSTARDQQANIRNASAFADEYAKMLGPEEFKGQNEQRARLVGEVLRDAALRDTFAANTGKLAGESDQAQQFRLNQLKARREDLGGAGITQQGETGAKTADKAGGELMQAAAKLAAAAAKLEASAKAGTPSILGPP